ncbi:early nodulin-like protein 1, partial [Telopea speciosissima]|uniref:early nodulin-like protein 1 n=1 Tax=Telopea speciosissima TaxID=54955 RepID=UPI001CC75CB8
IQQFRSFSQNPLFSKLFCKSLVSSMAMAWASSLILLFLLFTFSEANGREILVGGKSDSWKIPSSAAEALNHWAEATRFKIGDSLIWNYDPKQDSVVEVDQENYDRCNTSNSIAEYKDGNTKVKLNRSGPFYFISGAQGNCQKGEKLIVVVLSPNHDKPKKSPPSPSPGPVWSDTPVPSPMGFHTPAPAPEKSGGAGGFSGGVVAALMVFGSLVGMALFF